ncbi:MAG TPA: MEDS domain-containing protein [Nitrososphaeraceae archaeon]|nr:MEDS domain-containing protein [Nitrososphaeraceae archaeon]
MLRSPINGNSNDILKQLRQAEYGAHYIIVYYDMMTLRQLYTGYIKTQLEYNNELVLILPYYETTETVRSVLSGENNSGNGGSMIDVRKYEKEGSLIIIDSAEAYFTSDNNLMSFVEKLAKQVQTSGRNGISVIADLASFYYFNRIDKLIEYEMSLPTKYDDKMKLKGFCFYHKEDFDRRLSKEEKQKLVEHHAKALRVVN